MQSSPKLTGPSAEGNSNSNSMVPENDENVASESFLHLSIHASKFVVQQSVPAMMQDDDSEEDKEMASGSCSSSDASPLSRLTAYSNPTTKSSGFSLGETTPSISQYTRKDFAVSSFRRLTILDMPNEVLLRVFSFLPRCDLVSCTAVCLRFFQTGSLPALWQKINLGNRRLLETALHRIMGRRVMAISLYYATIEVDRCLQSRNFNKPLHVKFLDLGMTKFAHPEMLLAILRRCVKLECLDLEGQLLSPEALQAISRNRSLRILNLTRCTGLNPDGLADIFRNCPLQEINFSSCLLDIPTATVLVNSIPSTVQALGLSSMNEHPNFDDAGLGTIIDRLTGLVELDISDNGLVSSEFVTKLVPMQTLKKLSASRCYRIEPMSFTTLAHLDEINVFGSLSEAGLTFLREHLPDVCLNENPLSTIARGISPYDQGSLYGIELDH